jgi:integrase
VWQGTGRVFTREDGSSLRPGAVSEHFATVVARLGLPLVRFHDLRHGAATMLLAAGQPPKVISQALDGRIHDGCSHRSCHRAAEAAASAIAALIPRRTSSVPNRGLNDR